MSSSPHSSPPLPTSPPLHTKTREASHPTKLIQTNPPNDTSASRYFAAPHSSVFERNVDHNTHHAHKASSTRHIVHRCLYMLLDTAYIASAAGPSTGMWYLDTVDRLSGNAHRNAGARSKAPVRRKGQQYYAHHAGGPKTSSTRSGGLTISSRPCLSTDTKTTLSIVTSGFAPMFPLPMEGIICHAQYSEGLDDTSLLPPSSPVHPAIHSAHHHHQSPTGPEALMHMHVHQRPLYAYIPLPPLTTTPVELNPLLKHTSPIPLEYDITIPPSNAVLRARVGNHGVWVCANATQPGVQSMVLRTSVVGRPIVVHASTVNYAAVTIWDALLAVHDALREDAGLERSGSSHACVEKERRHRQEECMHLGMDLSKNDMDARAKLLVLVGPRRRWAGLEESTTESDVWILHHPF